jgi:hypothetical protein
MSRVWREVESDWEVWNARSFADDPIVRLILDGTVVLVRLDWKATSISLMVVVGVRQDGQKVLLVQYNTVVQMFHSMSRESNGNSLARVSFMPMQMPHRCGSRLNQRPPGPPLEDPGGRNHHRHCR